MTTAEASLGDLADLAIAVGLADAGGTINADWLTRPGDYLASMLSDDGQRNALLDFVASVLDGEPVATVGGRRWVPITTVTTTAGGPTVRLFVVIDDRASGFIGVGVGARVEVADPRLEAELHVPLFRSGRGTASVTDNILMGEPGADIGLSVRLRLTTAAPVPGQAHLGGLAVTVVIPTDGTAPSLDLSLTDLQLPGGTTPRNVDLDPGDPAGLTRALRDLVFGLAQSGADSLAGAAGALAGILGLRGDDALAALPLDRLPTEGLAALSGWLDAVLADPAMAGVWLGHLATALGGVRAGDTVTVAAGGARVRAQVRRLPSPTGLGRITVGVGVELDAGPAPTPDQVAVSAAAELLVIDLGAPSVTLLPTASAQVRVGPAAGPANLIPPTGTPAVSVGALRVGLALDADRRPVAVLAADRVRVGAATYDTIDLTNPGAVAEVAASAGASLVADLLAGLGPTGALIGQLLGLGTPTCQLDPVAFVADPVAALAERWRCVLNDGTQVTALLTVVKDLLVGTGGPAVAGGGGPPGTGAGPWRFRLAGRVELQAWMAGPSRLVVALASNHSMDNLGQRCTVVETTFRAELADLDLAGRRASFLGGLEASLRLRARGAQEAVVPLGQFTFLSDPIGLRLRWTPVDGLGADLDLRNVRLAWEGRTELDVPIPSLAADGTVTLPPEAWRALQPVIAVLADASPDPWLASAVRLFGWDLGGGAGGVRLGLDALVADPLAAVRDWLVRIALDDLGLLELALDAVARILTGTAGLGGGRITGRGVAPDPLLVPIGHDPRAPALSVFVDADPAATAFVNVSRDVQIWRPGAPGFPSAALAEVLATEGVVDDRLADLLRGRPDPAGGLDALTARWEGSDGVVIAPAADAAGETTHRLADVDHRSLADAALALLPDVAGLAAAPPVLVCIALGPPGQSPFAHEAGDVPVDLSTTALAPEAFVLPPAAPGRWVVALGTRPAARVPGDPATADPTVRQAARLGRLLDHLGALGQPMAIVAHGGAGHAARLAASTRPSVGWLLLAGTPVGDVPLLALDTQPGADALRLLDDLLPAPDPAEPDDADLALGRALVTGFMALTRLDDPGGDLRPGTAPAPAPAAEVHRFHGVLARERVEQALTAVVLASLADRAKARTAGAAEAPPARAAWVGVRLPLPDLSGAGATLDVAGWAELLVVRAGRTATGAEVAKRPHLRLHLELGAAGGWLVGGPDPARGTAPRPDLELRRLELDLTVPLPGAGAEPVVHAELVLHDATVFGARHQRWVVRPLDATGGATPLLPEVRALLSAAAGRWRNSTDPTTANLRGLLAALGVMEADGHLSDAVEHLLTDPDLFLGTVVGPARRDAVASALATLLGRGATAAGAVLTWPAGSTTVTADLGAGTLDVVATVAAGGGPVPAVAWHGTFHYGPTAQVDLSMSLGGSGAASAPGPVRVATGPFRITVEEPALGLHNFSLWPIDGPAGAPGWGQVVAGLVTRYLPAEIGRLGLDRLRALDADAQPTVDAVLGALGILTPVAADGTRTVRSLVGLLSDPGAWFTDLLRGASQVDTARLSGLLDGLRPVLGLDGASGRWDLATGVSVRAVTDGNGRAALALSLDTAAFAPAAAATGLWGRVDAAIAFPGTAPVTTLTAEIGSGTSGSVALAVMPSVLLELRTGGRPPIRLFPDPAGLGQLASAALAAGAPSALAMVLDAVAGRAGQPGLEGLSGQLVVAVGDALALRPTARFDPDRLRLLADAPGPYLTTRANDLVVALAARLGPLFGLPAAQLSVSAPGGVLTVTVRGFTLTLRPTPLAVGLSGRVTGALAGGTASAEIAVTLTGAGLTGFMVQVGPVPLPVGGAALRPYARFVPAVAAPAAEARRIELGLGLAADGSRRLGCQWLLDTGAFGLVRTEAGIPSTVGADVAAAVVEVMADVVASIVLAVDAVEDALDNRHVGTRTIRQILSGVVLTDDGTALSPGLQDPARLLGRVGRLGRNLALAAPAVKVDGVLTIGPAVSDDHIGLRLGLDDGTRYELVSGDVIIALETDASWIHRPGGTPAPPGIEVFVADVTDAGAVTFTPGISVNGLGLRISRSNAPLLDMGVRVDSVAVHAYCEITPTTRAGGGQIEVAGLGVPLGGATGGDNAIAAGIMADAKGGASSPPPKFSPALAVQRHGNGAMRLSLRAGPGDGPWWMAVQRAMGPVYIEQVGFGVTLDHDDLVAISLLVDGRVTLFGLTAAVDDLRVTYLVGPAASLFDPASWGVDLGGLAISGDLSGLAISGGLLKMGAGTGLQYLGSLAVKFGPYGLSVFGGYAKTNDVVSFFAFGALNAPIGGPPAFFVTGIGGGIGINRGIVFPDDLSQFNTFPFIRALDPAATPPADPMAALRALSDVFPIQPGNFWFAAGLSFTSFALIDGVVVISIQIGAGFELALLGLARVALPRPQFALVSIEMGLLARFSTAEGSFVVRASLTDNSWVLVPALRLTGGFAFATWWAGPNRGHAVVTLGGYHPNFHRDGYPEVPRLGVSVEIGPASVRAGFYFALTSEAIMAGGRFEASVDFGWAGASLEFEANGIIFFDPFQYEVDAHARVSAWADLGLFDIHVSIGAGINVKGPDFHGTAYIEYGPLELEVSFGNSTPPQRQPISWNAFVAKYLEESAPGVPRALSAVTGAGSLPAEAGEGVNRNTPDGVTIPFRVFAEFEALLTTAMPAKSVEGSQNGAPRTVERAPVGTALGLAPVGQASVSSVVKVKLIGPGGIDRFGRLRWDVTFGGGFPVAVWGPPQDPDNPKVPEGTIIDAITGVTLAAVATIPKGTEPIPYHQVDALTRKPNPLASEANARSPFLVSSAAVSALVAAGLDPFATSVEWLAAAGVSRTVQHALKGERAAPPILGTLADGLSADAITVVPGVRSSVAAVPFDRAVHPPVVRAVLSPAVLAAESIRLRTTVTDPGDAVEVVPRRLVDVAAAVGPHLAARLSFVPPAGAVVGKTVAATGGVPLSRSWRTGAAAVAGAGEPVDARARMAALGAAFTAASGGVDRRHRYGRGREGTGDERSDEHRGRGDEAHDGAEHGDEHRGRGDEAHDRAGEPGRNGDEHMVDSGELAAGELAAGEVAVLDLPNARADTDDAGRPLLLVEGGPSRVVALAAGGDVLADASAPDRAELPVPLGTQRMAVISGDGLEPGRPLRGWHGGLHVPYVGWATAVVPGATARFEGARVARAQQRAGAGWVTVAELVADAATVTTRFGAAADVLLIVLEGADADPADLRIGLSDAGYHGEEGTAVVAGHRAGILYRIKAEGPFTVTVAAPDGGRLFAVLAGSGPPERLAAELTSTGIESLVPAVAVSGPSRVRLGWRAGDELDVLGSDTSGIRKYRFPEPVEPPGQRSRPRGTPPAER